MGGSLAESYLTVVIGIVQHHMNKPRCRDPDPLQTSSERVTEKFTPLGEPT